MNKLPLVATLAVLLACGCSRQEPAAALPPASEPATPAPDVPAAASSTPAPLSSEAAAAAAGIGDKLVNARIDKVLGEHGKYQAVIGAYQAAVASDDRNAVAELVRYPLVVSLDGQKASIKDAAAFVQHYDRIITPAIARVITAQEYAQLRVNQQGVMFGNGESWINGICKPGSADCSDFEVRIIAIQSAGPD